MKLYYLIFILLFTISCSKKTLVPTDKIIEFFTSEEVLNSYNQNIENQEKESKPVKFYSNIEITKANSLKFNTEIYIDPNKLIWVNLYYFGFSMGKILITESKIEGYEKITKTFISEDINTLKEILKLKTTKFNLVSLQKLLLGKLFLNANSEDFKCIKNDESFNLISNKLVGDSLNIKEVKFNLTYKPLEIVVENKDIKQVNLKYEWDGNKELVYPKSIEIDSPTNPKFNKLKIDHKSFEVVTFKPSFEIPKNYKKRKL
ncbi:MAG: DUF4292 domain-containing protein [Solirubrobacteraceae bacterium]